ncbi:hypothetical protein [Thermoleptolyngbya sp. C42_A2020_037]|uniref:hypothetical protein n=1 Tax=Thermoleptolyngbya sp. C42_A2020_037 TaxID=2747799 RepID=UPI0019F50A3F|nr:hypothetical protein [Thermoleptolyngbya sp. C42_A2020_037]MBF2082989.1 hypothetical protein [Thermoleptolyngbya sp. C42_A2020_037]
MTSDDFQSNPQSRISSFSAGLAGASLSSVSRKSVSPLTRRAARSSSDDTFATARSLGTYTGGRLNLRRRDSLSGQDRIDIFSLTVPNGVSLPAAAFRFSIQKGRVRYTLLGSVPSFGIPPQARFTQVLKGQGQINTDGVSNTFGAPVVVYFQFERLGKKPTKYNFRVTSS